MKPYVKIVVDYIQIINLIKSFRFYWPKDIQIYFDVISRFLPFNDDSIEVACFFRLNSNSNQYFIKLIFIQYIQPLLYLMIGFLILKRYAKKSKQDNQIFRKNLEIAYFIIIYTLLPGIIKNLLSMFYCVDFGVEDPDFYLFDSTETKCSSILGWRVGLFLTSFPVWIILPIYWFAKLIKVRIQNIKQGMKEHFWLSMYHSRAENWYFLIFS